MQQWGPWMSPAAGHGECLPALADLPTLPDSPCAAMMVYNGTQDELEGTITDPAKPPTAGFVADAQCQARCKAAS